MNEINNRKILIVSEANKVTGGCECLHQLCDSLIRQGYDAEMLYLPFLENNKIPVAYEKYNIKISKQEPSSLDVLVWPETMTAKIGTYEAAYNVIWWLSVDFYYGIRRDSLIKDLFRYVRGLRYRKILRNLRQYRHIFQSMYSQSYMENKGIFGAYIGDYVDLDFCQEGINNRENYILYNPAKGMKITRRIIEMCSQYEFIPLVNYSRREIKELLWKSKIYIDFGNHPGRDRFPREAALSGCIVITGDEGAAANEFDINIPSKYKVKHKEISKIDKLIDGVFCDYMSSRQEQENYIKKLKLDKNMFDDNVRKYFQSLM